ncbi:MAG: ABC transporter ATP-binding protein [Nanoarchaeota archaeon]|nr:ABC transporter ATP-binding protein [Nanoarchaeota archaeon]MEC8339466.1 ABC transporter ATP-binding protein [Nanoarchaeota archaeon]
MKKENKSVIELKDIWKTYYLGDNTIDVLKGISFSVPKGEFVAIVGKSGSGKTTLVNQVGCLDSPSKGQIILDGEDVSELSESALAKVRGKKIGYVFQKFNLIKTLSAQENVELPMIFQAISKEERSEKAKQLLETFDMGERLLNKPSELSGGQQQRVAIARALANEPEILLADEPTGNLDSKTGIVVMRYLQELHAQGKTIILVTHDDKLSKCAQRIITLIDGKIISDEKNSKILKI